VEAWKRGGGEERHYERTIKMGISAINEGVFFPFYLKNKDDLPYLRDYIVKDMLNVGI